MHQQEFGSADRNKRQNAAKGEQRTPPHLDTSETAVVIVCIKKFSAQFRPPKAGSV
jgi:hypothetical protein